VSLENNLKPTKQETNMSKHLILLGDSIFDNGIYVEPGQADVTEHLQRKIADTDWTLDQRAVDGAVVSDISLQLSSEPIPKPCTFVISAGGNDALGHVGEILQLNLSDFHTIKEAFRSRYVKMINQILTFEQPLIVCTIYNPKYPDYEMQVMAEAGLSFFNDVITQEALRLELPIIDLREVCASKEAFANPIEPSEIGGDLITNAIVSHLF
jgi:hypothetical protein